KRTFYYGVMTIKNEIYPHNYDPLISKELFDKVQERKKDVNKKPFKYAGKEYYYRGLIRCAKCGYSVTPEMSKGHVYYHCTQYGGKHNAEWIREEELTDQIMEAFYLIQPNEEQFNQVKDSLQASRADKNKYKAYHLNLLQTTLTKTEKRLDSLQEKYIDGDIEKEYYKQSLVKYKSEQKDIKSKINAVDKADDEFYSNIEQIMELVRNAPLLLEKSNIEKKRILINYVLQNLELDGRQLRWKYKKPFNLMASCNKTSNWLELGHGNITINDNSLDFDISEIDSIYDDSAEDK
ncbi:MAG: zinc ribbon domain-containing protein, partial [Ignavibacteria bacterium]|nr:zinc ribbon domain-containing protein [Ignavibacteria bacterium]